MADNIGYRRSAVGKFAIGSFAIGFSSLDCARDDFEHRRRVAKCESRTGEPAKRETLIADRCYEGRSSANFSMR